MSVHTGNKDSIKILRSGKEIIQYIHYPDIFHKKAGFPECNFKEKHPNRMGIISHTPDQ
jgi:hypothetical protein